LSPSFWITLYYEHFNSRRLRDLTWLHYCNSINIVCSFINGNIEVMFVFIAEIPCLCYKGQCTVWRENMWRLGLWLHALFLIKINFAKTKFNIIKASQKKCFRVIIFLKILIACVYSILWLLLGLWKEENKNVSTCLSIFTEQNW